MDLGAHAGQTAASAHLVQPRWSILCFEPDPAMRRPLLRTAIALRGRMRFRMQGVQDYAGTAMLHIPMAGDNRIEGEATFSEATLRSDPITVERLRSLGMTHHVSVQRPVVYIDALDLSPVAIKLDLQGGELLALRGGLRTLQRCKPAILMENNADSVAIAKLLRPMGYRPRGPFEALNVLFTVDA